MAKNPNIFQQIQLKKPNSNVFDLSHDVKMSLDMGKLIPTLALECVPGDKFNISCETLVRFAPLVAPVMHRYDVSQHYFFVPNRLVWDNWETYITNQDTTLPIEFPYVTISPANYTEVCDYMGIPEPAVGQSAQVSAIPFAAYQCIYDHYYKDQNLISITGNVLSEKEWFKVQDGDNTTGFNASTGKGYMRTRAWEHDYFTSALPFAQKGDPVAIPFSMTDTVVDMNRSGTGGLVWGGATYGGSTATQTFAASNLSENGAIAADQLYLDGDKVTVTSNVIDMRRAFVLQEWLERNARAGTRYIENILAHFGVWSSDKRLQRAEYITGVKTPVVISEVLNTTGQATIDDGADAPQGLPQGNMAGHAVSVQSGYGSSYFCEEHGYIIGIMSIMPKTCYQNGIPKHFLKTNDNLDFYWPSFAHIGEQAIQNQELYAYQAQPTGTFGYVPRYSEYKFIPNRVAGDFRNTLEHWHHARKFASAPSLNQSFIECVPDKRIFAVEDENVHSIFAHILHKITAVRRMPKFGNPGL